MSEIERSAMHSVEPAWRPGDIVIDRNGDIFQRAGGDDAARGWPWHDGAEQALYRDGRTYIPDGAVDEHAPERPLTLLVRDGQPVTTIVNSCGPPPMASAS